ncbi:hypothetical protein KI387_002776, partial [Taxus chinensis]
MEIETLEEAISRITGMDMDGLKIFKDMNRHEHEINTFFIVKERVHYFTDGISRSYIL